MSTPSSETVPELGINSPAITRSNVLLPAPEAPNTATTSPRWTCSDRSSSTARPSNVTEMPTASSIVDTGLLLDARCRDEHGRQQQQDRRHRERLRLRQSAGSPEQPADGDRQRLATGTSEDRRGPELAERDCGRKSQARQNRAAHGANVDLPPRSQRRRTQRRRGGTSV